jgi:hypothetical protein
MRAASDADEQPLIRKGPALRTCIDKEFDALGKVANALNRSPEWVSFRHGRPDGLKSAPGG